MRYSVVNRFRGTFLGAIVGKSVALEDKKQSQNCLEWEKMAILGAESLIELGRFDLDDWLKRQEQAGIIVEASSSISLELILATVPITLFFHENTSKLRQNLLRVVEKWQDNPVLQDWTLAVGYAIAQSLTEKLTYTTLIPQIISFLGETSTKVPQILLKLDNLLEKRAGLELTQAEFSREEKLNNTMAMAFYCFVSTLEDFRISILRANQVNLPSPLLSAITGALSGAYNGTASIPLSWRLLSAKSNSAQWQLTNLSQMLKLADALVATWSGVYYPASEPDEFKQDEWAITSSAAPPQAIAAPRVIRLR